VLVICGIVEPFFESTINTFQDDLYQRHYEQLGYYSSAFWLDAGNQVRTRAKKERIMTDIAQIVFKDVEHSDLVEERISNRIHKLERIFDRIISCKVWVRASQRRHTKGMRYIVDIELHTPMGTLTVGREPGDVNAHENIDVTVRDAFNAMERQLRKHKELHSGRPEEGVSPLQGTIERLEPEKDSGHISTTDGRLIYFHRNAVIDHSFDDLKIGSAVELVVDREGAEGGPHASTVRPISKLRLVNQT